MPVGITLAQSWLVHNRLDPAMILMATFDPDIVKLHAVWVVASARLTSIGPPAMPLVTLGVTWMFDAEQGPLGKAAGLTACPPVAVVTALLGVLGVLAAGRGVVVLPVKAACGGFDPPPLNIAIIAISRTMGVPRTITRLRQYTAAGRRLTGRRGGVRRVGPVL